jgi:ABC-2 type transport system permease protein
MNSITYIAGNEVRRMFQSSFAWVILAIVQFLLAQNFYLLLAKFMQLGSQRAGLSLSEVVIVNLLQSAGAIFLLAAPFITMRLFSDELRSGTIKLLLSSPLSVTDIVLGKYLGIMMFFQCLVILTSLLPLSLATGTTIDSGLLLSGLLALILLSSAFAAIGLFISSLSKSPAIAAVNTFIITLLFWTINISNESDSMHVASIANYLSIQKHFNALLSGAFSSIDVIYFLLISSLFIALSIWRLDALRTHQ